MFSKLTIYNTFVQFCNSFLQLALYQNSVMWVVCWSRTICRFYHSLLQAIVMSYNMYAKKFCWNWQDGCYWHQKENHWEPQTKLIWKCMLRAIYIYQNIWYIILNHRNTRVLNMKCLWLHFDLKCLSNLKIKQFIAYQVLNLVLCSILTCLFFFFFGRQEKEENEICNTANQTNNKAVSYAYVTVSPDYHTEKDKNMESQDMLKPPTIDEQNKFVLSY